MITIIKLHVIGEKAEKQKCLPNVVVVFTEALLFLGLLYTFFEDLAESFNR